MTRSANIFLGLFTAGTFVAVAMVQPSPKDSRAEQINGYRKWSLVTPEAVYMAPWVAALCRATPEYDKDNPHVQTFFRVFVNQKGQSAMKAKNPLFPVGSVIVKEKFEVTSKSGKVKKPTNLEKPNLLTVMVKREEGFSPKNGNWEYFTADGQANPNSPELSTKHCQSCHLGQKDKDYTFRSYGPGKRVASSLQSLLLQYPKRGC